MATAIALIALWGVVALFALLMDVQSQKKRLTHDSSQGATQQQLDEASIATFAAWCFWCTEAVFQEYPGVLDAISGYAWGVEKEPSYEEVASGKTSHREAIRVFYDPALVSYETLLDLMFKSIDPTDAWGQFTDRGFQYTTAIFYHTVGQQRIAEEYIDKLEQQSDKPIVTKVLPFTTFFKAEPFHQDFYKHSKERYARYKDWSWRGTYFEESGLNDLQEKALAEEQAKQNKLVWDGTYEPKTEAELRELLSSMQYRVTQNDGTEPPFANLYRNNEQEWIYVDIVSGEPLFSSKDKYKSGTWWPSFVKPIAEDVVTYHEDTLLWTPRTEVRSVLADSHLGHVFDDGPIQAWGKRYCMNSAALEFIPLNEMKRRGYEEWIDAVIK